MGFNPKLLSSMRVAVYLIATILFAQAFALPNACDAARNVSKNSIAVIGDCVKKNLKAFQDADKAVDSLTKKAQGAVNNAINKVCRRRRMWGIMNFVKGVAQSACKKTLPGICKKLVATMRVGLQAELATLGFPTTASGCILGKVESGLDEHCDKICGRRRLKKL